MATALVVSACGGGGGGGSSSSSSSGSASSQSCPKGAKVIHMRNIRFEPQTVSVKAGTKVCWVNDDDVQHDAVADGGAFKSSLFGQGQSFTATVRKTGSIAYVCTVHPGMTGTLKVSP
jgi:plastocyanin